jgi:hypothetical protein
MTPQEKATELTLKMYDEVKNKYPTILAMPLAKQCALIAVDEVLSIKKEIWDDFHREYFEYWQQVKAEIEKL